VVDDAGRVAAAFWPRFQDASDADCEPDVLLAVHADTAVLGVLVEVKYKSDMSGWPSADEDPNVRSQLGREWFVLHEVTAAEFPG
jgi:hypothetical protein